jgi:hypothetical protein
MTRLLGRLPLQTEQKYPVLLEYAKASFERIKQRLRHLWALARAKRVLNDYTLASDLDRQFGDMPVGLRKILLSMIHGFAHTLVVSCPRSSRCPFGRLLGRNWFKWYTYLLQ